MRAGLAAIAVLAALSAGVAQAQTTRPVDNALDQQLRFSVGASTAGLKAEVAYRFSDQWQVRGFVGGGITVFVDGTVGGIEYDTNLRLGGAAALIDYYPFRQNRFRVSGGVFFTDTLAEGSARGDLTVGETEYTDVELTARIKPKDKFTPLLSIGYEIPLGRRFFLSADIGGAYNRGVEATLSDGSRTVSVTDLVREVAEIERDPFPIYPFVSLNLGFVF